MGFRMEFDERANLFILRFDGLLTEAAFLEGLGAGTIIVSQWEFCKAILDLTEVTELEDPQQVVRKLVINPPPRNPGPRVLVAKQDLLFGLFRMMQVLGAQRYPDLHVVRSLDEAYEMLKINPAELHLRPVELPGKSE